MTFVATWPCLKRISVGIERTSNCAAVCWLSSTLSLTIFSASPRSPAISSSTGATMRHGPHHGAQKSTRTGVSDSRTSAWKLLSVTSEMAPKMWLLQGREKLASESIATRSDRATEGLLPDQAAQDHRRDPRLDRRGGQDH